MNGHATSENQFVRPACLPDWSVVRPDTGMLVGTRHILDSLALSVVVPQSFSAEEAIADAAVAHAYIKQSQLSFAVRAGLAGEDATLHLTVVTAGLTGNA